MDYFENKAEFGFLRNQECVAIGERTTMEWNLKLDVLVEKLGVTTPTSSFDRLAKLQLHISKCKHQVQGNRSWLCSDLASKQQSLIVLEGARQGLERVPSQCNGTAWT